MMSAVSTRYLPRFGLLLAATLGSACIPDEPSITDQAVAGGTVAVGLAGEVVWAEAFGWADLSHQEEATPETLYPVGSISKSMTALAAGALVLGMVAGPASAARPSGEIGKDWGNPKGKECVECHYPHDPRELIE